MEAQIRAADIEVLDLAHDSIDGILDLAERARVYQVYQQRRLSMTNANQRAASERRERVKAPE